MRLGYSEFSFGYAFTENLIRSTSLAPGGAPVFPNLFQEGRLGYDVRIDFPGCPLYFQYKSPDLMVRNTAAEISRHYLNGIATPFFRMHLMKRNLSQQHQLLIDLENQYPNSVYYAAPVLRSAHLFDAAYNSTAVHLRSVLFSPGEIGPLPDDKLHVVAYRDSLPYAWFCSKPREIRAFKFKDLVSQVERMFEEMRYGTLREMARTTLSNLMQLTSPQIRNSESAIRERFRASRTTHAEGMEQDEEIMEVVEDLLVSREVARVALGLDFIVAQPSA